MPKTPHVRGVPVRCLNRLTLLLSLWRSPSSSLSPSPNKVLPYLREHRHPLKDTHFCHLCCQCHSLGHYLQLVAIGEGRNSDRPRNRQLHVNAQLSLHHNRLVQCPHRCRHYSNPSVTPLSPHLWTGPWDTWTPLLRMTDCSSLCVTAQHFFLPVPLPIPHLETMNKILSSSHFD